jgi:hypothetical protein
MEDFCFQNLENDSNNTSRFELTTGAPDGGFLFPELGK